MNKTKHIAIVDNYDSFTFNLVHYLESLECTVVVFRNDQFDLADLADFDALLLSPGPGLPKAAGLTMQVLARYAQTKKILGICLGHQAIGEFFGAKLENLNNVMHGVATPLVVLESPLRLYQNVPDSSFVGRYHSWAISMQDFPNCLNITAVDPQNCILSIEHKQLPLLGIQYHPESLLSPAGKTILTNWLNL